MLGALRTAQLVAPGMRLRGHGRIINVSSVAGRIRFPGMGAYAMSKHALESVRQNGAPTSTVFPKVPMAEFTAEVIERLSHNPAPLSADKVARTILRAATARHPKGRYRVGTIAHVMLGLHDALPGRLLPMMAPTPKTAVPPRQQR